MKTKKGFTLIELLVVVSIIALLVSILLPALGRARQSAQQVQCLTNTRTFGTALTMYSQDNRDYCVTGRWAGMRLDVPAWYTMLTEYLDSSKSEIPDDFMFQPFDMQAQYNHIWNQMICPAEKKINPEDTQHGVNQGVNMLTYGIHYGAVYAGVDSDGKPRTYANDYGLCDWATGQSRQMTLIRNYSSMMAFADVRDVDYTMANFYYGSAEYGVDTDWYVPSRHPGGYMVTFVDGHSGPVGDDIIRDKNKEYLDHPIWKIK